MIKDLFAQLLGVESQFNSLKKIFFILFSTILLLPAELLAAPAFPGEITVTQDDGSSLQIRVHGDEFFRWRTTTQGHPIGKKDGYYYYVKYSASGEREFSSQRVVEGGKMQSPPANFTQSSKEIAAATKHIVTAKRAERASIGRANTAASSATTRGSSESSSSSSIGSFDTSSLRISSFPTTGEVKSIVLLLQFADVSFTTFNTNTAFSNMLNQEGYSANQAEGSAKDYFTANSGDILECQFDVYGPYTLPNNMAYYGANDSLGNDIRPGQMVIEGAKLALEAGVDFSQYDFDNDGVVDNIFVFYAGYGEAYGASEDTIWAHMWWVTTSATYSGKKLNTYACASELMWTEGSTMASIGTFCHEFGHVFGLLDHYDTDGEVNGLSSGLFYYDIMSYGNLNNGGITPPLYNALELLMLGWVEAKSYNGLSEVTQQPITEKDVYYIETQNEGEFFLIENRQGSSSVWEEFIIFSGYDLSDGLFITHVDMSTPYHDLWWYNSPNNDISHECFRFMPANNTDLNYITSNTNFVTYFEAWKGVPYPQSGNNSWNADSSPRAESWSGELLNYGLSNITTSGKNITYSIENYIYYTTAWQYDALIGWYNDSYDSYLVTLTDQESNTLEYRATQSPIIVDELEPGSSYNFYIYGEQDSSQSLITQGSITTLEHNFELPIIALSEYEYSSPIYLKAINLEEGDSEQWYINGVETTQGEHSLEAGEALIKCEVKRGDKTYTVIKEILVK